MGVENTLSYYDLATNTGVKVLSIGSGRAKANGREPKSCLGRGSNSKLGRFAIFKNKCMTCAQPLLKLKTRPKFSPVI